MRVLLDTNVLVSALISAHGAPATLLRAVGGARFELITSHHQIDELTRVLAYPRIRARVTPERAESLIAHLASIAHAVEPMPGITDSPDPDDNIILGAAIAGRAQLIVSGDASHMVSLGSVRGIPIVTPAEALTSLRLDETRRSE